MGNVVTNSFGAVNEGIDWLDDRVPALCTATGSVRSDIDAALFAITVMAPEIEAWQQASAIAAQLRGAEAAGNGTSTLPEQLHHFATNKNKAFTPEMQKIADQFGLRLDGAWNKELMPHLGRHPNEYHDFVLGGMRQAQAEAGGSAQNFLELFNTYVKEPVLQNPSLLRKSGW